MLNKSLDLNDKEENLLKLFHLKKFILSYLDEFESFDKCYWDAKPSTS